MRGFAAGGQMQLGAHTQFTGLDNSSMARRVQFEHVPALELLPGAGRHVEVVEVSSAHPLDAWLTTTDAPKEVLLLEARAKEYELRSFWLGTTCVPSTMWCICCTPVNGKGMITPQTVEFTRVVYDE
jgi:hypothetical protein